MLTHGVETDSTGKPRFLRLGWAAVLPRLSTVGDEVLADLPDWARNWRSRSFSQVVRSFQDTMWKFDVAAEHVAEVRKVIREWQERPKQSLNPEDFYPFQAACRELPLFLDSLLFYLRIEADQFAAIVRYLHDDGGKVAYSSFRDHRKWVLKRPEQFDPAYAEILSKKTAWFEQLAGRDPKGFRDMLVHHSAWYQVDWIWPNFRLQPWLVCEKGIREPDVITAIAAMTAGWFAFLDSCWQLFVPRLREISPRLLPAGDEFARVLDCGGVEGSSFWVYPPRWQLIANGPTAPAHSPWPCGHYHRALAGRACTPRVVTCCSLAGLRRGQKRPASRHRPARAAPRPKPRACSGSGRNISPATAC